MEDVLRCIELLLITATLVTCFVYINKFFKLVEQQEKKDE
jgi:hypothetical protein